MFPSIVANDDYCSSVNEANFDRVVGLIEDARAKGARIETVAPPGEVAARRRTRKIAPTIVRDVDDTMLIADGGDVRAGADGAPVRPARPTSSTTSTPVRRRSWRTGSGRTTTTSGRFVRHTRSGGVARNDFAAQMIPSAAPFGGVGRSGMGAYHGKAGFDAFSHYRTVVGSDLPFTITGRAAPPFTAVDAGRPPSLRIARWRATDDRRRRLRTR